MAAASSRFSWVDGYGFLWYHSRSTRRDFSCFTDQVVYCSEHQGSETLWSSQVTVGKSMFHGSSEEKKKELNYAFFKEYVSFG